jgi:YEATS domain-containing protein 4
VCHKNIYADIVIDYKNSWGEFEIQIRITFIQEAAEKPLVLFHHLKLHPWPAIPTIDALPNTEPATPVDRPEPVHSWQYDEVCFHSDNRHDAAVSL